MSLTFVTQSLMASLIASFSVRPADKHRPVLQHTISFIRNTLSACRLISSSPI